MDRYDYNYNKHLFLVILTLYLYYFNGLLHNLILYMSRYTIHLWVIKTGSYRKLLFICSIIVNKL